MTVDQLSALAAAGYNRVPVTLQILADLDTPLSTYLKLARQPWSYLLESAQGGETWGRYSIIGLPCRTVLKAFGHRIEVTTDGRLVEEAEVEDPLAFVEAFQARYRVAPAPGLPRFYGGLVGYFGYDCVRYVESKLKGGAPPDPIGTPDLLLMVSEDIVIFDNLQASMQLVSLVDPNEAGARQRALAKLEALAGKLREAVPPVIDGGVRQPVAESDFVSEFGEAPFKAAVQRIREYTRAGDVMQVVLAQRMSIPFAADPINLYRALRHLNPSPYMYFMDLDGFQIVSSSPEIMARLDNGLIINRPLAGTRRRGHTPEEDLAMERELRNDPKEIAEHLMLIDLGRNDVGRVAEIGSVRVTEQFTVERYSHVMHLSSNVIGRLKAGCTAMDLLRSTLPVGTLSGAPKIRAMQIIDELEPVKRGVYGGAVGYLGWNGNMDTAIAIRTAVVKEGKLHIEAGGGIVADSSPELEWKESMNKGRAIFRAAAMAAGGLQALGQV